jgi:hypothetical protein
MYGSMAHENLKPKPPKPPATSTVTLRIPQPPPMVLVTAGSSQCLDGADIDFALTYLEGGSNPAAAVALYS